MSDRILAPAAVIAATALAMSTAAITLLLSSPAADGAARIAGGDVMPFLSAVFSLIAESFWALLRYL